MSLFENKVKMRSLGHAIVQYDWYAYKKREVSTKRKTSTRGR